jgi:hypothetical protein
LTLNIPLSFPENIIKKIDEDRRDVNRSRYVVRLIEQAYNHSHCQIKNDTMAKTPLNDFGK